MRVGPLLLSRVRAAESSDELGYAGTSISKGTTAVGFGSGVLTQTDYNSDLRGTLLYDEIDKMRLSDSVVKGMLRAVKLPLLSATWSFEPGDDTPEQLAMAEWLNGQLDQMNWSWKTVLRHILLYLDFGVMPFEVVFEVADDPVAQRPMARLRKLAPRMPRTISEWVVDERGGLAGVVQQVSTLGGYKPVSIPIERLLVFVNDLEGANWKGTSILRAARKDWYYKDRFQRLGGIIMEKRGAGVDVGKLTRGDATKKAAAERVLMDVRTHERAFVLETEDFEYRIESAGAGGVLDPLPWVQYYDLSMLRGLLVEFLALGGGDAGSWALARDKTSFFLMSLRSVADEISDIINRHLVRRWCDMNWAGLAVYPSLRYSKLDRRDAVSVIEAIAKMVPLGVIEVAPEIQAEVRELLELPEMSDESTPPPALTKAGGGPSGRRANATQLVDWMALKAGMTSAERAIVEGVKAIQKRQIQVLVREALKRVQSGNLSALDTISVPFKAEASAAVEKALTDLYRTGQREAKKEIQASFKKAGLVQMAQEPLDPMSDKEVLAFLGVRAGTMISSLSERLRGSMMRNVLDLLRRGEMTEQALTATLSSLSDRAISTEANLSISEALNLGRDSVAKANSEIIKNAQYSALLDEVTCDSCGEADGREFRFGSSEMEEYRPPYKECSGGGRCRCVLIYTLESED